MQLNWEAGLLYTDNKELGLMVYSWSKGPGLAHLSWRVSAGPQALNI